MIHFDKVFIQRMKEEVERTWKIKQILISAEERKEEQEGSKEQGKSEQTILQENHQLLDSTDDNSSFLSEPIHRDSTL